jgi:predicted enzyme related to lactoylglutathione lyase
VADDLRRYPGWVSASLLNVTFDCGDPAAQARFWSAVTGLPASEQSRPGNPFWVVGHASVEGGPRLVFVPVTEPKRGKNRVHLDVVPADRSQAAELDRLVGLGASVVDDRRRLEGGGWVVLADPEGNEFCLEGD